MNITKNFLSLGKKARSGRKFAATPDSIVIHWIGPWSGSNRVSSTRHWWEHGSDGTGVTASAHFIVCDDVVLQCLPLDEVGWHSGDNRNYSSIGIEVVPMHTGKDSYDLNGVKGDSIGTFSEKTIETLKELYVHLCVHFDKNMKLERHYDGTQKKDCPRYYTPVVQGGQERWNSLVAYLTDLDVNAAEKNDEIVTTEFEVETNVGVADISSDIVIPATPTKLSIFDRIKQLLNKLLRR